MLISEGEAPSPRIWVDIRVKPEFNYFPSKRPRLLLFVVIAFCLCTGSWQASANPHKIYPVFKSVTTEATQQGRAPRQDTRPPVVLLFFVKGQGLFDCKP